MPSRFLSSCPYFTKPETKDGSYSGTRCYPKILKLSYLPYVPSLPYPHIYHRSFSVQVSLFVLVMTHYYWVLFRPPTKVGQSGGGSIYIYIHITYIHTYYGSAMTRFTGRGASHRIVVWICASMDGRRSPRCNDCLVFVLYMYAYIGRTKVLAYWTFLVLRRCTE